MTKRIADSPCLSVNPSDSISNCTNTRISNPTLYTSISSRTIKSTSRSGPNKDNVLSTKRQSELDEIEYDNQVRRDGVKPLPLIHHTHNSTRSKRPKIDSPMARMKNDKGKEQVDNVNEVHHDQGEEKSDEDGPKNAPISPCKARLSAHAKHAIAQEIVRKGVAALDVTELARQTGLTVTQIRSQICDNRMNLRRQLMQFIQSIQ